MSLCILIHPEGTPADEKDQWFCLPAIEYDEELQDDDGNDYTNIRSSEPVGPHTVRVLSEADAQSKADMILANKFNKPGKPFKGLTWVTEVVEQ